MSLDPRVFRHMNPCQIALALAIEEGVSRQAFANKAGKKCVPCMDTGMTNGRFCGCEAGQKLGNQSFGAALSRKDQANV